MLKHATLACIVLIATAGQASAQQSWPITCRAGRGMTVGYTQDVRLKRDILCQQVFGANVLGDSRRACDTPGATYDVRPGIVQFLGAHLSLTFESARQGANTALPQAGQCAFLDRPIFENGQRGTLRVSLDYGPDATSILYSLSTDENGRLAQFDIAQTWGNGANGAIAKFLIERWQAPGELFTVYARDDNGALRVTGFEPNAAGPN